MSGGVDSSVTAYLLSEQGYEVIGVTMQVWHDEEECRRLDQLAALQPDGVHEDRDEIAAAKICEYLGIPHYTVYYRDVFRREVISDFVEEYLRGRTPNPCVRCNRYVKWDMLLKAAQEHGADWIATGHYGRVLRLQNGRYTVSNCASADKDQTYVLYRLTQEQLSHALMPLGEYDKPAVRRIAAQAGIPSAAQKDSQDACFAEGVEGGYAAFIEQEAPGRIPPPGRFRTTDGQDLGEHRGITHYTIGQRKRLGISLGHRAVVTAIHPQDNTVVIGRDEDVYSDQLVCRDLNFLGMDPDEFDIGESRDVTAKIRYAHKGAPCTMTRTGPDEITCRFREKVRAVTPGQSCVFYEGGCEHGYVLGGGIIQ